MLDARRLAIKSECEADDFAAFLFFVRYFFKVREAIKFRLNWHHVYICWTLYRVYTGELKNAIINVPPGSSKTEIGSISFMAWGLAKNPRAKFLHISFADDLVALNSTKTKEIILSSEFQELWPTTLKDDSRAKKRWNVDINGKTAGGVYAVSLGGTITGFRAGTMAPGFSGAIIIDDPLKPKDALSDLKRKAANDALNNTVKSRKATDKTPIIIIMQRLHEEDPTGFCISGGMPESFDQIKIPAILTEEYIAALPEQFRTMIEEEHEHLRATGVEPWQPDKTGKLECSYWEFKEPIEVLQRFRKVDAYTYAGQYDQTPVPATGGMIKKHWIRRYDTPPDNLEQIIISADTASKASELNDPTAIAAYGVTGTAYYLLDVIFRRMEYPELKRTIKSYCQRWGPQAVLIEDKSSGMALIQELKAETRLPVIAIEPEADKITRLSNQTGHIEAGRLFLPNQAPWLPEFEAEIFTFPLSKTKDQTDQLSQFLKWIGGNQARYEYQAVKPTRTGGFRTRGAL